MINIYILDELDINAKLYDKSLSNILNTEIHIHITQATLNHVIAYYLALKFDLYVVEL
jgi:methionine synthase II (cobalamin-independent)